MLFLKGLAMGAADSVPGVSGGTIAFITNIYDELLASILAVNRDTARLLLTRGPRSAWLALNGEFLAILGSGILVALIGTANLVLFLLEEHYAPLMAFFVGLIAASVWHVNRQLPPWTGARLLLLLSGVTFSVAVALLPRFEGNDNLLYYFFCGAVAICAMILPGISGAFILLLLGAYQPVLLALTGLDFPVILVFAGGCLCGLLSFARLLFWLLRDLRAPTLTVLLGVLAGSLYNLWPWREAAAQEGAELLYRNISPLQWAAREGWMALLLCLWLMLAAFALVWVLETLGGKSGKKSSSSEA